jgi:hypothetical protein
MESPGKLSQKALNSALRKLSCELYSAEEDGTPITRADALAKIVWCKALGWMEEYRDESGNLKKEFHKPEPWAIQYVFERLEGKSSQAVPEQEVGVRAADKVRALAKERLNKLAVIAAGPPQRG